MAWEYKVLKNVKNHPHFSYVLSNETITPITIEYYPEFMNINHLPGEFPPFIRLESREGRVFIFDNNGWSKIEEENIVNEFQILRIYNPSTILGNLESKDVIEIGKDIRIDTGTYNVKTIELPSTVVRYFKEADQIQRWVKFWIWREELVRMSQMDLPPFPDIISQVFSHFPGVIQSGPIFLNG